MLQSLRVKDLAIVEDAQVDFTHALNVITGETGAGKSVLIGALGLLLGGRADRTMIRAGADRCTVEACFDLADPVAVNSRLDALGLEPCEEGKLVIRRRVAVAGAGKQFINDCAATLQALKKVGDLLVDMHGPHDHQSLLSQEFQLELLDAFGKVTRPYTAYQTVYQEWRAVQKQRADLDGDDQQVAQQIDLLAYQVREIEDADLKPAEDDDLEREHTRVANAHQILALLNDARQLLTEGDSAAFNALATVQTQLADLARLLDEAAEWRQHAETIAIDLQELAGALGSCAQDIEGDPARLQWLDDRLALIRKLQRKYGGTPTEILTFLETAKARLTALETRGERLAKLEEQERVVAGKLKTAGRKLSTHRQRHALSLAQAITAELRDLGFAHGVFEVTLTESPATATGLDLVEFGFAPNAGEPMRPLRAIASSGEISRVMLATKTVLASHDRIPVLVFDEVDANVGGEMGNAIGAKLAAIAENHQVLCITHLPQVAVHGVTHFVVNKAVRDGRTCTGIQPVTGPERDDEVARMLGGKDLTSVTLEHARQMLQQP